MIMTMKTVLQSFAYCLDFLREQVEDVAVAEMVAQPSGIMNHPAWVIGHLTYICQKLGGVIALSEWLPDDWGSVSLLAVCRSLMQASMKHSPPQA